MFSRLFALTTATLIAILLLPSGLFAQTLTPLEECIVGFYAAVDEWDATVPVKPGYTYCDTQKGVARIHLQGRDNTLTYYWNFNSRLYKDGAYKACSTVISRNSAIGGDIFGTFVELAGREAAQWNKFLKTDGCVYALSKVP